MPLLASLVGQLRQSIESPYVKPKAAPVARPNKGKRLRARAARAYAHRHALEADQWFNR